LAKAQNAKAQKEIANQIGGIDNSAMSNFNKYEEKINKMDFEATALTEIVDSTNKLDREFDKLESDTKVSTDLDKLKQKLALEKEAETNKKAKDFFNDKNNVEDATIVEDKKLPPPASNDKTPDVFKDDEVKKKKIDDFFKKP
jgi:hypothetical protein